MKKEKSPPLVVGKWYSCIAQSGIRKGTPVYDFKVIGRPCNTRNIAQVKYVYSTGECETGECQYFAQMNDYIPRPDLDKAEDIKKQIEDLLK